MSVTGNGGTKFGPYLAILRRKNTHRSLCDVLGRKSGSVIDDGLEMPNHLSFGKKRSIFRVKNIEPVYIARVNLQLC